jgi:uncharacterized small protein (DUF1192 family)
VSGDIDTSQLRAAFVQAQAQIMNNGEFTPVVVIDKTLALGLLDEIERLRAEVERKHDYACRMDALAEERLMEITRLRAAGDALAVAYRTLGGLDVAHDAALLAWGEARRER